MVAIIIAPKDIPRASNDNPITDNTEAITTDNINALFFCLSFRGLNLFDTGENKKNGIRLIKAKTPQTTTEYRHSAINLCE